MRLKNVSPLGELTIPALGTVDAGEEFDVTGDLAQSLLDQPENFERVDKPESRKSADKSNEEQ